MGPMGIHGVVHPAGSFSDSLRFVLELKLCMDFILANLFTMIVRTNVDLLPDPCGSSR